MIDKTQRIRDMLYAHKTILAREQAKTPRQRAEEALKAERERTRQLSRLEAQVIRSRAIEHA